MTDGDASAASLGELVAGLAHWSPDADGQEAARLRAGDVACAVHLGGSLPQWVAARQAYGRLLGEGTGGCWLGAELASCCRITEIDDIDLRTCTTPGSVAVPAALVFASQGAGTADVLAGIAAGYEVILAAAAALGGAFATAAGTWPTRAAAALGAA
ncbi:MAG: hypothetical protein ACRDYZ_11545, partial [Acidimicrobiales bacterium]